MDRPKEVWPLLKHGPDPRVRSYLIHRLIKAKITGFEGKGHAKVKEMLPVGTDFSFKWKIKEDTAKLDGLKGDKVELLKSRLEGEYSEKK